MTLPKIDVPTYSMKVLSTNSTIKYRPFLVKEEKILLVALESGETDDIINAIQQILDSCIVEGDINTSELPTFDIENIFLNIRAKSVGETSDLNIPCVLDTCEEFTPHTIDLEKVGIITDENHTNKINLTNKIGVIMKYPSVNGLSDVDMSGDDVDQSLNIILACIDSVFDGKNEYDFRDYTSEERIEFIENLTQQQLSEIQNFFETMPVLRYDLDFKCGTCGERGIVPITGLQNFFS